MRSAAKASVLSALLLSGCATTTIVRNPQTRMFTAPSYETTEHFFFWGLVRGKVPDVPTESLCLGKGADQVQVEHTSMNALYTILTLGIYVPETVRVWCSL